MVKFDEQFKEFRLNYLMKITNKYNDWIHISYF